MKRIGFLLFLVVIFLVACCTKVPSEPLEEREVMLASEEGNATKVEKPSMKEQMEALTPEDPRRQLVMTLTWQIQYQRERLKNIELRCLAKCYQDKEYRNSLAMIERLNKQIITLMLL